jgi:hypothetical protein
MIWDDSLILGKGFGGWGFEVEVGGWSCLENAKWSWGTVVALKESREDSRSFGRTHEALEELLKLWKNFWKLGNILDFRGFISKFSRFKPLSTKIFLSSFSSTKLLKMFLHSCLGFLIEQTLMNRTSPK